MSQDRRILAEFGSYSLAGLAGDAQWQLSAQAGPDVTMSLSNDGFVSFSIKRWEFKRPDGNSLTADAAFELKEAVLFAVDPELDDLPEDRMKRGQALLEACKALTRSKVGWGRGSEAEADQVIQAAADLSGHPLKLDVRSCADSKGHLSNPAGKWSAPLLDDIIAYFKAKSRSGLWSVFSDRPTCTTSRGPLSKCYEPKTPMSGHERLDAAIAIEAFYAKARKVLRLDDEAVKDRIAEICEGGRR